MPRKKSVLIIEDDIHYGEMVLDAIRHFGYEGYLAYSATGGLDIVRQRKLDLIMSDINMPGINGIELAEKLMNMFLDIPIILMTGVSDLKLVKKALELGVSDYLVKPVKIEELPIVIEKCFERYRLESQKMKENKADILLKALKALMRALDAKDPETHGHSQRVADLALLMAGELHLEEEDTYTLHLGAYLHDIGKIGMPDSILNKSEDLQEYEADIAKTHPLIGSQIIGEISELSEIASIVRHHHEHYDGSGYPDGLRGEAIPYLARIIAIVDSYEALVSDRVYRRGTNEQKALEEIERNAGIQFDPELVRVFVQAMRRELKRHAAPTETVSAAFVPPAIEN